VRKIHSWYRDIGKKLSESTVLQDYVAVISDSLERSQETKRLVRLIVNVELGLTLLAQVAPDEAALSVSALLSGYRYAIPQLENDENWQTIRKARFYLIKFKGRYWEKALKDYIKLPQVLRIYNFDTVKAVPRLIPSSTAINRSQVYQRTLSRTPNHQTWQVNFATAGRWFCKISQKGSSAIEIPIDIPAAVAAIATSSSYSPITRLRHKACNPPVSLVFADLLQTAQEMTQKHPPGNWYERLHKIEPHIYDLDSNDFQPGEVLRLDKLIHIVGLLNVGKSTLLEVLSYHLAKQGYRCALVVNDVVTAVRNASMFWHQLGIQAAPVLGSDRQNQLKKVHETTFIEQAETLGSGSTSPKGFQEGEEIFQGGVHPALRWFSSICPLLALVQSEEKWEYGQEPCHQLYQYRSNRGNQNTSDDFEDDGDFQVHQAYSTCPLYYQCPRHQLERDLAPAKIWVLTPASFIHTRVPRQISREKITFAEAVYRECDFLFVDEADRVQLQLDDDFAPSEVLVNASQEAYLNKMGSYTSSIYQSARDRITADRLVAWLSAQYNVQNATNRVYNRLLTQEKLVEWLGSLPFTGQSLFAKIIRELVEPQDRINSTQRQQTHQQRINALRQRTASPSVQQKQIQKQRRALLKESKLNEFLGDPLALPSDCELSILALRLLRPGDDQETLAEVKTWCHKWLASCHIETSEQKIDFEELTRNVHFAILIAVLNNQLSYLVDSMPDIRSVLDLQDLNANLLKRPPSDYLPLVPESPVGSILGFCFTGDRNSNSREGKLDYFRYVGIGRALLLNFPTLFAIDDREGPHTVLISGTSYAPGSPQYHDDLYYTPPSYHIDFRPSILLRSRGQETALKSGISDSNFVFRPLHGFGEIPIPVSGCHSTIRKQNVRDIAQSLCSSAGELNINDVFQAITQRAEKHPEQWTDRVRFLMVVGSYQEAEDVHTYMQPLCPNWHLEPLRRDQSSPNLRCIRRSQISGLKDTQIKGIFAPLMALERGYNILNQYNRAAFGAALFLNRPMPVPDDWHSIVQQLNAWALQHEKNSRLFTKDNMAPTLITAADAFYLYATTKMRELSNTASSFHTMTEEERDILCWNQLVKIWQIIGRLVRGNVPANVYFIDAKFAPLSAEYLPDKANTSLLVSIIKTLKVHIEGKDLAPYQITLARSLYQDFFQALKNTEGLNYVD